MATCNTRTTILGTPLDLDIRITDALDNLIDPTGVPEVQIKDSHNSVIRVFSSTGVVKLGVGLYRLTYTPPSTKDAGLWTDLWRATVGGESTTATLTFTVLSGSSIAVAGAAIGDAPCTVYSQAEINGINILLQLLKCRLKNTAESETIDEYGRTTYEECSIFSDEELLCFLVNSLSDFNACPHWTSLGFDSVIIYERNAHVIVEGAYIIALGAQMLIEAGREFSISDNGVNLAPPPLSTVINNQFGTLLAAHNERVKFIKCSMKPSPLGIGGVRITSINPAYLRLRHLRERQIF